MDGNEITVRKCMCYEMHSVTTEHIFVSILDFKVQYKNASQLNY